MNPPDIIAVQVGNRLAKFSISALNTCRVHGIPCFVENLAGSRLRLLPAFNIMARHTQWREVITHYCMWGKPWKKPTCFAGFYLDLLPVERLCRGRALCSRTGCKHQSLQGTAPSGAMWTKVAEPYPTPMCNSLAGCFGEAHGTRITRALGRLFDDWFAQFGHATHQPTHPEVSLTQFECVGSLEVNPAPLLIHRPCHSPCRTGRLGQVRQRAMGSCAFGAL